MALVGPLFVAMGLASFQWPSAADGLWMFGKPVQTNEDKVIWTLLNVAISAVGLAFVWWHVKHWGRRERAELPNIAGPRS